MKLHPAKAERKGEEQEANNQEGGKIIVRSMISQHDKYVTGITVLEWEEEKAQYFGHILGAKLKDQPARTSGAIFGASIGILETGIEGKERMEKITKEKKLKIIIIADYFTTLDKTSLERWEIYGAPDNPLPDNKGQMRYSGISPSENGLRK